MSTDTVEEPAVVADDHSTTSKSFETFFKCAECVDIDVVGWLIEKQHVALFLECHGKVETVAFTSREHATEFALIGTIEVESAEISTHVGSWSPCR